MVFSVLTRIKRIGHFFIAHLAAWRYGRPSRKLVVIGVTGTKGKSSTCRFIASVLEAGGYKVGLLSTVDIQIGKEKIVNKNQMTMLGRGKIQKYLRDMVRAGCAYAVIETSSEGILQHRHAAILYDVAVFINLGTEHHERHGGYENLKQDKGKLFKALTKRRKKVLNGRSVASAIVVNADDKEASFYLSFKSDEKWAFGIASGGVPTVLPSNFVRADSISNNFYTNFSVRGQMYELKIAGEFNVYNALAAIAVGYSQAVSENDMSRGIKSVEEIPGRMQFIDAGQPFSFIVDYAHEPMSFEALFSAVKPHVRQSGKLIGIIGSDGGGRDTTKRGLMGEIAGRFCDIVIIADVNPWDEEPYAIAEMIAVGARKSGKKDGQDLLVIINRQAAIEKACELSSPGSVVVITAKGAESSISGPGGKKTPWSDAAVSREILSKYAQK